LGGERAGQCQAFAHRERMEMYLELAEQRVYAPTPEDYQFAAKRA